MKWRFRGQEGKTYKEAGDSRHCFKLWTKSSLWESQGTQPGVNCWTPFSPSPSWAHARGRPPPADPPFISSCPTECPPIAATPFLPPSLGPESQTPGQGRWGCGAPHPPHLPGLDPDNRSLLPLLAWPARGPGQACLRRRRPLEPRGSRAWHRFGSLAALPSEELSHCRAP